VGEGWVFWKSKNIQAFPRNLLAVLSLFKGLSADPSVAEALDAVGSDGSRLISIAFSIPPHMADHQAIASFWLDSKDFQRVGA
jgi:hypothetical protein